MHEYDKATAFTLNYRAWDVNNNAWIQEDAAAKHTLRLLRDGSYAAAINTPQAVTHATLTGLDAHSLAITAAEADCDRLEMEGESSTEGVIIIPWIGQAAQHGLTAGQAATLDAIESKTDLIGSGKITVVSPVDGESNITVRRARDYNNADGLAIEFSNPDGTWPDLTNATIALLVARPGSVDALYSFAGTVVTPTGANQTVRVELTAAQLAIDANDYAAEVVATLDPSGRKVTLADGTLNVILGREAPV